MQIISRDICGSVSGVAFGFCRFLCFCTRWALTHLINRKNNNNDVLSVSLCSIELDLKQTLMSVHGEWSMTIVSSDTVSKHYAIRSFINCKAIAIFKCQKDRFSSLLRFRIFFNVENIKNIITLELLYSGFLGH